MSWSYKCSHMYVPSPGQFGNLMKIGENIFMGGSSLLGVTPLVILS